MPSPSSNPETTKPDDCTLPETLVDEKLEDTKRLNRVAEEAAEQAGKTERRYDQDHSIFTK